MAYTLPAESTSAPSARKTQYFEILGNRALYHDGWVASTTPPAPPWASVGQIVINAGRFWFSVPSPYVTHEPMLGRTN